jgi:hypothetical protein
MDEPLHDSDEKELVACFTLNIFNGLLITYLKYHIMRHGLDYSNCKPANLTVDLHSLFSKDLTYYKTGNHYRPSPSIRLDLAVITGPVYLSYKLYYFS